jgi:putative CocE/NonD family hydrolase
MAYEGSQKVYDVVVERGVMVPTRDGVDLATDIYRPALGDEPVQERLPVVLERTPYDRSRLDLYLTAQYFASRGYAVALQDCRGRYDSGGDFLMYDAPESYDGYDTVEWLAAQPWSNGRIGTTGLSFTGANQQALAILRPPHLTTQVVLDAGFNYWYRTARYSGAHHEAILLPYAFWMAQAGKEAMADPLVRRALQDALVNIRDWIARAPLKPGASPLALAPTYERWYFKTVTHGDYDDFWQGSHQANLQGFADEYPDIPLLLVPSWYGHHTWANFEKFNLFRRKNTQPVHVICGIWLHAFEYMRQSSVGEVDFGNSVAFNLDDVRLRWFDRWLKDMDTSVVDWPPLQLFVMGGGSHEQVPHRLNHGGRWRAEQEWPLGRTDFTNYYLHANGALGPEPPAEQQAATTYTFDPDDPAPTIGGSVQDPLGGEAGIVHGGGFDQRGRPELVRSRDSLPLAARADVLVFRSGPLEDDVEVTGPIVARLWVSSSARDTDFTAKLIDEYPPSAEHPTGFALNVTDGILRMRYRNGRTIGELIEPDTVYEIEVEPLPTSNVFARGHRIRLDVSSSSAPQFDVNPNTGGPLGVSLGSLVARNTVFHDRERPSHLVLPIVPSDVLAET